MKGIDALKAFSADLRAAEEKFFKTFGCNSYSDAFMAIAKETAQACGLVSENRLGSPEAIQELHPEWFTEKLDDTLDFEQLKLLTAAEQLAVAAHGNYEPDGKTVLDNFSQVFGRWMTENLSVMAIRDACAGCVCALNAQIADYREGSDSSDEKGA